MANQALQLTGQATPSTRIPFLLHRPADEITKPQPLLIFLHGQNKGSPVHDTTSVLSLQTSDSGLPYLTNSANPSTGGILPIFTNPVDGEQFDFYMLAPQLYYSDPYPTGTSLSTLWKNIYVTAMIDYALANLNVDKTRIALCGYSLGAGGTVTAANDPNINRRICCWSGFAPGYGNGLDLTYLAHSGTPGLLMHCAPDTTAPVSVTRTIISKIRAAKPLVDPIMLIHQTGTHNSEYRLWDVTSGDIYDMTNGSGSGQPILAQKDLRAPSWFEWVLMHKKIIVGTDPLYV